MKKYWLILCCLLCWPALCHAAVPDEVLHEAVMTLTWPDDGGECWVEGHVVLGEETKGDTTKVYAQVHYQNYGFMDGVFTGAGGGSSHPAVFVFDHGADGYQLREILEPEDGENNARSLRAMMPQKCIDRMGEETRAEMERQMLQQAQAYLDAIGRTEPIQDWRERDLQLPDTLTQASNFVIDLKPPYPLWLTETERLEDGVRYVYSHAWQPDEHSPDGYTYLTADGMKNRVRGRTGLATLTKRRYDTGETAEVILIQVELYSLTVTFSDACGEISYTFPYDGRTYYQPETRTVGDCRVRYPIFEMRAQQLPQSRPVQETSAEIREENGGRTLVITSRRPNGSIAVTECPKAVRTGGALPKVDAFGAHLSLTYESRIDEFRMDEEGVWRFVQSCGYGQQAEDMNYAAKDGALQLTQLTRIEEGVETVTVFPLVLLEEGFDFAAEHFDISKLPAREGAITPERAQRYADEYLPKGLRAVSGSLCIQGVGILAEDASGQRFLYALHEEQPGRFAASKGNAVPPEAVWDDFHAWNTLNLELYGPESAYCYIGLRPDGRTWGVTYIGGVDWFSVEEYQLAGDRRYLGDHPWRTLDTADLTCLPLTLNEAAAQLDASHIAVVHNPDPADRLHLRERPDRSAKSLGKYYNGTIVQWHEIRGDWAKVTVAGVSGWMMTRYLAFGSEGCKVEPAFLYLDIYPDVLQSGLPIADQPDGVIRQVLRRNPADMQIIGIAGDWYHVIFASDGVQGYAPRSCFWEGHS